MRRAGFLAVLAVLALTAPASAARLASDAPGPAIDRAVDNALCGRSVAAAAQASSEGHAVTGPLG